MVESLYARFEQSFRAFGDRPFIEEEGRSLTYAEVECRAAQLSARLSRRGVVPGDRILIQIEKSLEALILYVSCVRLGAIYLPLNVEYTQAELSYFVTDAEPALAVCREESIEHLRRISQGVLQITTLADLFAEANAPEEPSAARSLDDTAAILYTSGTTGKPKGAMLSNGNLMANGAVLADLWRFKAEDRLIHALPIFHVHGLFVAVHCALFSGATLLFMAKFNPREVIRRMADATVLMGVPTFYTRLLADPALTKEATRSMRLFIAGSAPLSADTLRAFEERTGHRVLERYGMTETGMLTSNPYYGERRAGSVGLPLPGVEFRVADFESGREVPQGNVGSVEVRGAGVFKGYWRNPEKTASEFRSDNYFITGDMGLVEEDGYVRLVGREKDLIISGGLNIYPAEVEASLEDCADIAEAAVIGVPHPDFGEAVVAVVRPTGADFDAGAVCAILRKELAAFKVPKQIIAVDELPRNAMGKIQKKWLRQEYALLFA